MKETKQWGSIVVTERDQSSEQERERERERTKERERAKENKERKRERECETFGEVFYSRTMLRVEDVRGGEASK